MTAAIRVVPTSSSRRHRALLLTAAVLLATAATATTSGAQDTASTGTIVGRVTEEGGAPLAGAQVYISELGRDTRTGADGSYRLTRIPAGPRLVRVRLIGHGTQSATANVVAGQSVTLDFQMVRDPLGLSAVVVTGTVSPRSNI